MEIEEGVKGFFEFLKERLSNKFIVPYVFFYFTFNWPIFLHLFWGEEGRQPFHDVNQYLSIYPLSSILLPLFFTASYILLSPWINFIIEKYNYFVNFSRRKIQFNFEERVSSERDKQAKMHKIIIAEEAENIRKSMENEGIKRDQNIFKKIDGSFSEMEIRELFKKLQGGGQVYPGQLKAFEKFTNSLELVENAYSNQKLRESQSNVIVKFNIVLRKIDQFFRLKNNQGETAFVLREGTSENEYHDFSNQLDEALKVYISYRLKIKSILLL